MRKESLELLRTLLNTASPSGYEAENQRVWCDYTRKFADNVTTDAYGNAVAVLNPKGDPKIMIEAHIDEIGVMIRHIDDHGYIYFQRIGGIDPGTIRGKRVNIHTQDGIVRGVCGAPAVHLQERDKDQKQPKLHESFIDIGAKDGDDARKKVAIGDPVTFVDQCEFLNDNIIVSRGCDDRVGAWVTAEALRIVAQGKTKPAAALYIASSVQEEVGLAGARMNIFNVRPDAAIAVDVTHATDTPGIDVKQHGDVRLGKGPTVSVGREHHPMVTQRLRKVAKKEKIDLQIETFSTTGGTDAMAFYTANGGVPSGLVSIPTRYMHQTVEMLDLRDLQQAAELLAAFVVDIKKAERFVVKV